MGNAGAENQAANIVPPRTGAIIAATLSTTQRIKDLGTLTLGGVAVAKGGSVYLTLRANVKWYYRFSSVGSGTIDETQVDADANAITFPANACIEVSADEWVHIRVDRIADQFLIVKGSAAGILRGWASSDRFGDTA